MKALFFLRHYNDIDHITPVISKWLESGHQCDVVLIGNPKFHRRPRLPRYCDEWLMKLAEISPAPPVTPSQKELCRKEPKGTEDSTETEGLKVVIFLRKSNFTTFWEEIEEIVGMIAAFPNVELVIKPHTRGGWRQRLTRNASLHGLPNVSVAPDHIHSVHLMNWAHVIIDLATSVVFEAVKGKKPCSPPTTCTPGVLP